ncbi:hypothetical protein NPIL_357651 [Nephila pilipes]|uniref:Uncharacterized protein n=1 Tax=Nephila pilipes TaxID=299642 RepID=A0A8X6TW55_NEPPI|nr:hypothetical protein NPIL_357651 [Nephila pilipes]
MSKKRNLCADHVLARVDFSHWITTTDLPTGFDMDTVNNTELNNSDSETMHSIHPSSGEESEVDYVAINATPMTTPANLDKNPNSDTESDDNDGFTVVNRKKKKKESLRLLSTKV